jgi:dihydroneopterin aldolase
LDTLFVTNLELDAIIGIHPHERTTPQRLLISFELMADTRKAAASDDIADAVDYDDATQRIADLTRAGQFQLIETLAAEIAALLLAHYPIRAAAVEVRKPAAVANAETVGVRIERKR